MTKDKESFSNAAPQPQPCTPRATGSAPSGALEESSRSFFASAGELISEDPGVFMALGPLQLAKFPLDPLRCFIIQLLR